MNRTKEHQALVDDLVLEFGSRPYFRAFPRRVGLATPIGTTRPVYFGIKGEADIQGWFQLEVRNFCGYGTPKMFAVGWAMEVKTGKGKRTVDQENWKVMFESIGGVYVEARSFDQAVQELETKLGLRK